MFAASFLLFLLLAANANLDPCACDVPSFDLAWKSSSSIFAGRLIKANHLDGGKQELEFEISREWRGHASSTRAVLYDNPFHCITTVFVIGKEYLIYAQGTKQLTLGHCTRSRLLQNAGEDLVSFKQERIAAKPVRRDPFTAMQGDRAPTIAPSIQPAKRIPRTLNISLAVVVAISQQGDHHLAVIRGSDGKTYTMKEGDPLSDGKIERIGVNTVTFLQRFGTRTFHITKKLHAVAE